MVKIPFLYLRFGAEKSAECSTPVASDLDLTCCWCGGRPPPPRFEQEDDEL